MTNPREYKRKCTERLAYTHGWFHSPNFTAPTGESAIHHSRQSICKPRFSALVRHDAARRRLCIVRVDAKNRLVDGDTSGDLYAGLEQALRQKLEPPIVILAAERQVVAGLNWRILVQSGDNRYEAVILQKLPCHGGEFVLTDFKPAAQPPPDPVSSLQASECERERERETLEECDQPVSFALQSLSEQSNSLAPFELVRLVRATRTGNTHDMELQVKQGAGSPISVEMLTEQAPNGFRVEKLTFL